jgi:ABC-type multidrug transport system fused ATPase/permease subunit
MTALNDPNSLERLRMLGSFLGPEDHRRVLAIVGVMSLMALLEVVGIALVLPFLQLVADPSSIEDRSWLKWISDVGGFTSAKSLLVACGISVILSIALANLLAAYSVWQRQRLSWGIAHSLSMRLALAYAELPYSFFVRNSSAELIKKNIEDVNGLVNGVFLAGSQLFTSLLITTLIMTMLLVIAPLGTLICIVLIVVVFGGLAILRKGYISRLGRDRVIANAGRFRTYVDLIAGIKTVKTDGAKTFFVGRFEEYSKTYSALNPRVSFAAVAPRYIVEVLAFGAVILVTIALVLRESDLSKSLPLLSTFVVAGYRMMPAVSGAYASFASIISQLPAIDAIFADLNAEAKLEKKPEIPLAFDQSLSIAHINYRHDPHNPPALRDVSLEIKPGEKVAFVGPSGSGKTTLIDILMGLYEPQSGVVSIDGVPLTAATREAWREKIGYVPQDVFLYEDTLAQNVAFGAHDIDMDRLRRVCGWAQIRDEIENEMPDGYNTILRENGSRLSGGQKQRIGIARALYRQPAVLLMDEATSALDTITERALIKALDDAAANTTIIVIAHRLSTVRNCDRLIVMDQGKIVAQGSYEELIASNTLFQDLVHIS